MTSDSGKSFQNRLQRTFARVKRKLWVLPLAIAVTLPLACLLPYGCSCAYGLIDPWFPTISDVGSTEPPCTYIFSQSFDTVAILGALFIWIRYKQVNYYLTETIPKMRANSSHSLDDETLDFLHRMNFLWAAGSLLIPISGILLGNFRTTENLPVHFSAVFVTLTGGLFLCVFNVIICTRLAEVGLESAPTTMTALVVFVILSAIACGISMCMAIAKSGLNHFYDTQFRMRWPRDDPGYWWHIMFDVTEWLMIFGLSPIMCCMVPRMRYFSDWDKISF